MSYVWQPLEQQTHLCLWSKISFFETENATTLYQSISHLSYREYCPFLSFYLSLLGSLIQRTLFYLCLFILYSFSSLFEEVWYREHDFIYMYVYLFLFSRHVDIENMILFIFIFIYFSFARKFDTENITIYIYLFLFSRKVDTKNLILFIFSLIYFYFPGSLIRRRPMPCRNSGRNVSVYGNRPCRRPVLHYANSWGTNLPGRRRRQ